MYTNSQITAVIDEYVHSSWQREALKLRFCDGLTHEQIAEKMGYSTQYIKEVVKKHKPTIFSQL